MLEGSKEKENNVYVVFKWNIDGSTGKYSIDGDWGEAVTPYAPYPFKEPRNPFQGIDFRPPGGPVRQLYSYSVTIVYPPWPLLKYYANSE